LLEEERFRINEGQLQFDEFDFWSSSSFSFFNMFKISCALMSSSIPIAFVKRTRLSLTSLISRSTLLRSKNCWTSWWSFKRWSQEDTCLA
jgi:hypothetical protein